MLFVERVQLLDSQTSRGSSGSACVSSCWTVWRWACIARARTPRPARRHDVASSKASTTSSSSSSPSSCASRSWRWVWSGAARTSQTRGTDSISPLSPPGKPITHQSDLSRLTLSRLVIIKPVSLRPWVQLNEANQGPSLQNFVKCTYENVTRELRIVS